MSVYSITLIPRRAEEDESEVYVKQIEWTLLSRH